ncbi:MAG: DUF86 domain-containing protein [Candidatus Pacebacteria bacterium]|nr:DUF86 domain-containing protein [Candidatus Paceibacterota bacterium]
MKDNLVYLQHILDSIEKIEKYLREVSFDTFTQNEMMIGATVRELEIIGEAATNIDKIIKEKYRDAPWSEMIGMRHRLIHEYFGVDIEVVWDTCQNNLPDLKEKISSIVEVEK